MRLLSVFDNLTGAITMQHNVTVLDVSGISPEAIYTQRDGERRAMAASVRLASEGGIILTATAYICRKADGKVATHISLPGGAKAKVAYVAGVADIYKSAAEKALADWQGWKPTAKAALKFLDTPVGAAKVNEEGEAEKPIDLTAGLFE